MSELFNRTNINNIKRFRSLTQEAMGTFMTPREMEIIGHLCNITPDNVDKAERYAIAHLRFCICLTMNSSDSYKPGYNFMLYLHLFLERKFGEVYTILPVDVLELRALSRRYEKRMDYVPYLGLKETLKLRSRIHKEFYKYDLDLENIL